MSEDPVKVDPRQHTVEFENDQLRGLRIHVGPNEKSAMRSHPAGSAVFLTDSRGRFVLPDGTTEEPSFRSGQFLMAGAGTHAAEKLSAEPLEVIPVEFNSFAVARFK